MDLGTRDEYQRRMERLTPPWCPMARWQAMRQERWSDLGCGFTLGQGPVFSGAAARLGDALGSGHKAMFTPDGVHVLVDLYGAVDPGPRTMKVVEAAARAARTTVLKAAEHVFPGGGRTAFAVLSQSHASIHTWPEVGFVAFDLYTCAPITKLERDALLGVILRMIPHKDVSVRVITRAAKFTEEQPWPIRAAS